MLIESLGTPGHVAAMLLADGRLPAGASAHSAGLEAAWMAGMGISDVPRYIEGRLRTAATLDAGVAVLSHRISTRFRAVEGRSEFSFQQLDRAMSARMPSAPMRAASRQLGRGLQRLALTLAPQDPAVTAVGFQFESPYRPIALGAIASALGIGEESVAALVCYDEAQSIASAALKVLPGDPAQAAGWVRATAALSATIVDNAVAVTDPTALPAWSSPWSEQWITAHAHNTRRLFVS